MSEPIYIVSGFPRSGTSMMMRAIDTGGIRAVFSPDRDRAVRTNSTGIPNYNPNPHGFFELDDLHNFRDWPSLRGRVVKIIRDNLDLLPRSERLRICYMRRDPVEIARSYPGTMSGPCTKQELIFLAHYELKVRADLQRMSDRGADVVALDYAAVVADPSHELGKLNWPINIAAAVATVDPLLYRHRGAA